MFSETLLTTAAHKLYSNQVSNRCCKVSTFMQTRLTMKGVNEFRFRRDVFLESAN